MAEGEVTRGDAARDGVAVSSDRERDSADGTDELLRALARAPDASGIPAVAVGALHVAPDPMPKTIGGFEIVRTLGSGGMGIVFEAIDPTLRRKVAIKLVRSRRAGREGTARMLREAQALAKLSHPNVVTAYAAGIDGELVYLTMELVTGVTARQWGTAQPRSLRDIIEIYRQAARGLAVAHEAGLVHRDVKPENILVGEDGRVRITDFGLVSEVDTAPMISDELAPENLTATGTVLGTLPYIAPEAHLGGSIGARADQWSLCVALWEAIAGERPHVGATQRALVTAVTTGELVKHPPRMPPRVRAVLARGLAVDPNDRWPSLAALFDALDRARRGSRRIVAVVAGLAVIGGGGAIAAIAQHEPAPETVAEPPVATPRTVPVPTPRKLATPAQVCPYMPSYVDNHTLVFGDNNGHVLAMPALGGDVRTLPTKLDPYRIARGRRPGEAVFVSMGDPDQSPAAFIDVATGAVEKMKMASSSYAAGGGAVFYLRTEVPEIWRVFDGVDEPAVKMPGGRWPYTVATDPTGTRVAITTAYDRSQSMVCLADLDPKTHLASEPAKCLEDHPDIVLGRAAFSPDAKVLYYQTTLGIRRRVHATGDDDLWLPGAKAFGGIDVAPDGRSLVYSDSRPSGAVVRAVGSSAPPVLEGRYGYIAAVSGNRLIYVRNHDHDDDLVIREANGTVRVVIPKGLGRIVSMIPDPTSKFAVLDLDAGDRSGIYVVDLEPWPPVRISTRASDSSPIWTADGKVAYTQWDDRNQPSIVIVDPAEGIRGEDARKAAHPLPRVTSALIPTTGELALLSIDSKSMFLWNPKTDRERTLDVSKIGNLLWLAAASRDGSQLAVLVSSVDIWSIPIPASPADKRKPVKVAEKPPCATGGMPFFDERDQLYVVERPWTGSIHRVELP